MARLLLIDARVLTPDRDGSSVRMFSLLRIFQRLGFTIVFAPSFPESFAPFNDSLEADTERMRAAGIQMLPASVSVDQHLEDAGHTYDLVLVTGTFVAARHLSAIRRFAPQAALIFDTIDLHFLREYRRAKLSGSMPRVEGALKIKRVELAIARAAHVTVVVSEREQQLLAEQDPPIRSCVVPLTYEVRQNPGPEGRSGLVYLGAFTFDPNPDAMLFFAEHILPRIRNRLPGITLHIVGSDPTPEVIALQGDGVHVTGPVPNLADCFDGRRVFVAPLRYGAGVKSKLLLSMAHGLPIVASSIAAEGIPARDGVDLMVADDPDAWVDRVARLCEDDDLWRALAANGRRLMEVHHSEEAVTRHVHRLVDAALEIIDRREILLR